MVQAFGDRSHDACHCLQSADGARAFGTASKVFLLGRGPSAFEGASSRGNSDDVRTALPIELRPPSPSGERGGVMREGSGATAGDAPDGGGTSASADGGEQQRQQLAGSAI
eukprot:6204401-Pleurochrysis_carterae.AAC.1